MRAIERQHCFSCGDDWGDHFPCRLTDEADPEAWVQVHICIPCWQAAERQHQARLAEHERRLLNEWIPPTGEQHEVRDT